MDQGKHPTHVDEALHCAPELLEVLGIGLEALNLLRSKHDYK